MANLSPPITEYNFQESNNEKPWNMLSIPTAIVENANAKIPWDTPIQLESVLENGADEIDIAALDKQGKSWLLIGGTVCLEGRMKEKNINEARKAHRSTERNKEFIQGSHINTDQRSIRLPKR